jgi:hypothetical protein
MAGYQNFEVDRNKNSKGQNALEKIKNVSKVKENQSKDVRMRNQMKKWTSFYRLNVHRFVGHYFGIELFFFQKILLFFMNLNTFVMIVAARGLTFCIAPFNGDVN